MLRENLEQAKRNWEEKRAYFEQQLSITANAQEKFELNQRIQECEKEIKKINRILRPREDEELEGKPISIKWWLIGIVAALVTVAGVFVVANKTGIITTLIEDIIDKNDASKSPGISLGEEIIIEKDIPKQEELEKAFADRDYQQFRDILGDYLKQNPNSPELWVYWNNAKAALLSENPIKIAVSIPIETNQEVAEEILRGVALAQNEINDDDNYKNGINGQLLQVVIANDNNDSNVATQVAKEFVQDPSILAVVGHNASNATLAAKEIYEHKLVMITPTSFSDELQGDPYIFRMVPQISYFANKLAEYIEQENPNAIVGTCLDTFAPDNDSFVTQFEAVFPDKTYELPCGFLDDELTGNSLNKEVINVVKEIKKQKINSLVLAPYISRMPEMVEIIQNIHDSNLPIQLYGSPTFFTQKTLKARQAVEGLTLSVPWYPNKNEPKNVQFQQKFQQLYPEVEIDNWRTAMAYDATSILATGLEQISEQKQPIDREELNHVLTAPDRKFVHDGATGETTFSASGVNENQHDVLIQIKNGQFIKINN